MKKRIYLIGMTAALLFSGILYGCSSNQEEKTAQDNMVTSESADNGFALYEADTSAPEEAMEMEQEISSEDMAVGETRGQTGNIAVSDNRKLIRNIYMNVETTDYEKLFQGVQSKVSETGGYIQDSRFNKDSYNGLIYHNLVIRVPSKKLDQFVTDISEKSNVLNKTETTEDITLNYVDMESHKKSLLVEQERLMALLEKADKLKDIIALEERLSAVRYELEYYESQLRTYDNLVDYSTVTLDIAEVIRETEVEAKTIGERISTGFSENIFNLKIGTENFIVWFLSCIPYFLMCIVVIIIFVLIYKFIIQKIIKLSVNRKKSEFRVKINKNGSIHNSSNSETDNSETEEGTGKKQDK